jgi:prepilin-type N-terminal cleavage/methylation domain-containing protein
MKIHRRGGGFTLVEVVMAMVVFSLIALSVAQAIFFFSTQGSRSREKSLATQKAMQMLEELRGVVDQSASVSILDNYNDGINNNYVLTTNQGVTNPADPASGNGNRQLYRRVTVLLLPNDISAREVYVRVYDAASNAPISQVMSVLRTLPNKYYPTQSFDVYFIVPDNVPGWWVLSSTLRPILAEVVLGMQALNPGLAINEHWISQSGFGRDPYYTPWINTQNGYGSAETSGASGKGLPYVYLYPGWTYWFGCYQFEYNNYAYSGGPNVCAGLTPTNQYYYNPTLMFGVLNEDGLAGSGANYNTSSFHYADSFNHGMRYPDELTAWTNYSAASGNTAPTLHMLWEQLNSSSVPLKNALMMNLGGQVMAFPPIRNYSDPAKVPAWMPGVRVVTHPQKMQYVSGGQVKLRVYSYVTPEYVTATSTVPMVYVSTISVFIPASIPSSKISIRALSNGSTAYYWRTAQAAANCTLTGGTYVVPTGNDYCVQNSVTSVSPTGSQSGTEIVLSSSPLRNNIFLGPTAASPATGMNYGYAWPLYGTEYLPSPPQFVGSGGDFTEGVDDLSTSYANATTLAASNTARWVITIASGALADGQWQVQTRIGSDLTGGPSSVSSAAYSNLSNTYFWINTTPPYTETYQYMGDPRYEPYADSKYANSFNWYFADISTDTWGTTWPFQGYSNTKGQGSGWNGGQINVDVPRFQQTLRNGLLNSQVVWTSLVPESFYYYSLGGEIADDGSLGYETSAGVRGIPMYGNVWTLGSTSQTPTDEIVNGTGLPANAAKTWMANPYLGEIYPDAAFPGSTGWIATGNLESTSTTGGYYRAPANTGITPPGQSAWSFPFISLKNLGATGSPSFINATQSGNTLGSCWYQDLLNASNSWTGDTAIITATGTLISNTFNYTMPSQLNATGPYLLCDTGYQPPQWNNPTYSAQWLTSNLVSQNFVDSQSGGDYNSTASGLIMINDASSPPRTAYLMLNGMGDQQFFGADTMSQMALSTMMYSFMEAGISTYLSTPATGAIHQVPLVSISTPAATQQFINPSSIQIGWGISWQRWGGTAYTNNYSATFADPSITMNYNVKYSPGGGQWYYLNTSIPATLGVYNATYNVTSPQNWSVGGFSQGNYTIVVEGYRQGYPLHYTYQQQSVYIQLQQ